MLTKNFKITLLVIGIIAIGGSIYLSYFNKRMIFEAKYLQTPNISGAHPPNTCESKPFIFYLPCRIHKKALLLKNVIISSKEELRIKKENQQQEKECVLLKDEVLCIQNTACSWALPFEYSEDKGSSEYRCRAQQDPRLLPGGIDPGFSQY